MYRVMVVDDEPLVRTAIRSLTDWSEHGFLVDLEARNGEQALTILRRNPDVAILLLDIVMPAMDGIELLRRLRSEGLTPRVIVLSAHDGYQLVREAFKAGADDYILKSSLDADSLLALLRAAVRRIEKNTADRDSPRQLIREELVCAREELLRAALVGSEGRRSVRGEGAGDRLGGPAPEEIRRRLGVLELPVDGPILLSLLWLDDLDSIQLRYRDSPDGFFQSALRNTIRQVTERFGAAELIPISDGETALLLFPEPSGQTETVLPELLEEIQANVRHYLDAKLDAQGGRVVQGVAGLSAEYRRLSSYRNSASRTVVQARRLIKEHYADPDLGLASISRRLGVSRSYLSSEFAKETGKTLTDYLTETRIKAARALLLTTERRVYEISAEVGYRNVEHFCRLFRKATGCPPGAFSRGTSSPRSS